MRLPFISWNQVASWDKRTPGVLPTLDADNGGAERARCEEGEIFCSVRAWRDRDVMYEVKGWKLGGVGHTPRVV